MIFSSMLYTQEKQKDAQGHGRSGAWEGRPVDGAQTWTCAQWTAYLSGILWNGQQLEMFECLES